MADGPRILLLHRNQPAQFEFFGRWLARRGWQVTYIHAGPASDSTDALGIRTLRFPVAAMERPETDFRYALDYAAATAMGAAVLFEHLRNHEGYRPDVVMAHAGWGIGLGVRQIWPQTRYIAYHEWYYTDLDWTTGRIERPSTPPVAMTNRMRNLPISAEFDSADANWCPTQFQANRFPPPLRQQISVLADGVDCRFHHPDPTAKMDFDWLSLPDRPKLLTYATRGLEPLRGFPQFMMALARLQKQRQDFHTVVLAQDSVSYGPRLPEGESWGKRALAALDLDRSRLHLESMKPRSDYLRTLQASSAHIYFTEPFVTSWSLSEALASGCLVIGSRTGPVMELVEDMQTGILVDMDDPEEVSDMISWVFDHPEEAQAIRRRARQQMLDLYDSEAVFRRKEALLRQMISRVADTTGPHQPIL
ncbi:glycosyltransferase [Thioclava sp. GXIMD4215]|uniref:glycosyltransferase n=1 Tax=Thioclava sp. GXIMD4215 TaxID=3131928 RepID=UPI00311B0AF0